MFCLGAIRNSHEAGFACSLPTLPEETKEIVKVSPRQQLLEGPTQMQKHATQMGQCQSQSMGEGGLPQAPGAGSVPCSTQKALNSRAPCGDQSYCTIALVPSSFFWWKWACQLSNNAKWLVSWERRERGSHVSFLQIRQFLQSQGD